MMKFVAIYRTPEEPAGFDKQYFETHVPLVTQTPGLVRTELARVTRMMVGEPAQYLIAEMYFESAESMKAGFKSEAWRASGVNLREWGGMDLVTMFTAQIVDAGGVPT